MKWYNGLILLVLLTFGASVSQGQWRLRIREGGIVETHNLVDIDSLTLRYAPPTGYCCALDGGCTVTTQANCAGVWTEGGTCMPNPCLQPDGACCNSSTGLCSITSRIPCQGTWTLGGVCEPNPCPPPAGLVRVPAGTFTMGSPTSEPGRHSSETQHQVTLTKAIYVSIHEVTQQQWQDMMGWNDSNSPGPNRPVEKVTWYDAVRYCNQQSNWDGLTAVYAITGATYNGSHITSATVTWNQAANGYRLLTEAEWEYACRAASTSAFCNGGITNLECAPADPNLVLVGWYCGNASSTTHDAGGKAANAWGLKDMHGNVLEWCWDWYGTYGGDATDPIGPTSGGGRVSRGGSFGDWARSCRSALRGVALPGYTNNGLGLRVCRNAP